MFCKCVERLRTNKCWNKSSLLIIKYRQACLICMYNLPYLHTEAVSVEGHASEELLLSRNERTYVHSLTWIQVQNVTKNAKITVRVGYIRMKREKRRHAAQNSSVNDKTWEKFGAGIYVAVNRRTKRKQIAHLHRAAVRREWKRWETRPVVSYLWEAAPNNRLCSGSRRPSSYWCRSSRK